MAVEYHGRPANSRLVDQLDVLDRMLEYCVREGIKVVVFGGDLFEERKRVHTSVYNAVYRKLKEFYDAGLRLIMLVGNHDQAGIDLSSEHALFPLKEFATVIDEPMIVQVDDAAIYACPFITQESTVPDVIDMLASKRTPGSNDIALLHQGATGAKVSNTDYLMQAMSVDSFGPMFKHTFLGHYHMAQRMSDTVEYIGATMQHKWSDQGQPRGFLVYDFDTGGVKRIKSKAPEFIKVQQSDVKDFDFEAHSRDFVRVEHDSDFTTADRRSVLDTFKDCHIEFMPRPVKVVEKTSVDIPLSLTREDIFDTYAKAVGPSHKGVDTDSLLRAGRALLSGKTWKDL